MKRAHDFETAVRARGLYETVLAIAKAHHATLAEVFARGKQSPHVGRARCAVYAELRLRGWSFRAIGCLFGRETSTVRDSLQPRTRGKAA